MTLSLNYFMHEEPVKIDVELCKKTYARTKLCYVYCYNKSMTCRFGNISEIEFDVDKYVYINGIKEENVAYEKICADMILKVNVLHNEQYFVVKDCTESDDNKKQYKHMVAYSYEYTFSSKIIREFNGVKKLYDITDPENSVLHEVIRLNKSWKIGYVNPDINKYRVLDVSEQTCLDFLYDCQKTYSCVFKFDTITRTINVEKLDYFNQNKGLVLNEKNYLKKLEIKPNYDDMITRLYVYGKDDISINKFTSNGTSYIDCFDYYLLRKDVIDEGLINAIGRYDLLLESKKSEFANLLTQYNSKNTELSKLENELAALNIEVKKVEDEIDVFIKSNQNGDISIPLDITTLNNKLNKAKQNVLNKNSEINAKKSEIDVVNNNILVLRNLLSAESNFTTEELFSLNEITKEKVFRDTNIEDEEELYQVGQENLFKLSQPNVSFEVNLSNFLKSLDHQINWDKVLFGLGTIVNIENENLDKYFKVRLIEFTYSEDSNDFNLKFSNKDSIDDPILIFEELGKKVSSTSTLVDINKFKYGKYENERNEIHDYINSELDFSKQQAVAGKNQEIIINERGITLLNSQFPNMQSKIMNNQIVFTDDAWNTVKTALSNGKIVADNIIGKLFLGSELIIENASNSFHVDENGAVLKNADLSLISKNGNAKMIFNPTDGIKMSGKNTSGIFEDKFVLDKDGNLTINGNINMLSGSISWDKVPNNFATNGDITRIDGELDDIASTSLKDSDIRRIIGEDLGAVYGINHTVIDGTKIQSPLIESGFFFGGRLQIGDNFIVDDKTNEFILKDCNLSLTANNGKNKIIINPVTGIKIQKNNSDIFYIDSNGDLHLSGDINMTSGNITWNSLPSDVVSNSQLTNAIGNINIPVIPSYIRSTFISQTEIQSPTITAGTITGARILSFSSNGSGIRLDNNSVDIMSSQTQLAGQISFDTNGSGTASDARNRVFIRSLTGYALKISADGDMSLSSTRGGKIYIGDCFFGGTVEGNNIVAKFG